MRQKFTSYERDTETGLDFAEARYHANTLGRFTSIDPLSSSASLTDPQTLNRYAYVGNNPVNFSDPSGMKAYSVTRSEESEANSAMWAQGQADIAESEAKYVDSLAQTYQAISEAQSIMAMLHQHLIDDDTAREMATRNPMLSVVNQVDGGPVIDIVKVEVLDYEGVSVMKVPEPPAGTNTYTADLEKLGPSYLKEQFGLKVTFRSIESELVQGKECADVTTKGERWKIVPGLADKPAVSCDCAVHIGTLTFNVKMGHNEAKLNNQFRVTIRARYGETNWQEGARHEVHQVSRQIQIRLLYGPHDRDR